MYLKLHKSFPMLNKPQMTWFPNKQQMTPDRHIGLRQWLWWKILIMCRQKDENIFSQVAGKYKIIILCFQRTTHTNPYTQTHVCLVWFKSVQWNWCYICLVPFSLAHLLFLFSLWFYSLFASSVLRSFYFHVPFCLIAVVSGISLKHL